MVRILCVEDNPQNMRLVRKILNHQGYDVLEAEDGTTGVRLAKEEEPDLILMDINLPDIDGLEATGIIKGDESLKDIPIVALTANAMYGDEERCLAAGCDGYISKPVSKSKLLDVVADFLARRDTADESDTADDSDAADTAATADTTETESSETTERVNGRHLADKNMADTKTDESASDSQPEISPVQSPTPGDD
jgi:two-component system cell cycle response regulator DivK